jgi:thiamine-monophosphate kinase
MLNNKILKELNEKTIVNEIIKTLEVSDNLLDGFGHDSAFINTKLLDDEVLLMNSDRSGLNIAYKLGLSNGECVGDFAISHAVSDIFVAGGYPLAISVVLLLPDNLTLGFVKEVMNGAQKAAKKYGAFLASGDTKKNSKFAMVVTVIGKGKKDKRLTRANAKKDDLLVVTGNLGTMVSGLLAIKKNLNISNDAKMLFEEALIYQNPPYKLALEISKNKIANASIDNSDGLTSSIYSLCNKSNVGAIIYESKLPIHPYSLEVAKLLSIRPIQLTLTGGDWQYLYSIPKNKIDIINQIAEKMNYPITVIGKITEQEDILIKTIENDIKLLKRIENDRFNKNRNNNFFESIVNKIECFENIGVKND